MLLVSHGFQFLVHQQKGFDGIANEFLQWFPYGTVVIQLFVESQSEFRQGTVGVVAVAACGVGQSCPQFRFQTVEHSEGHVFRDGVKQLTCLLVPAVGCEVVGCEDCIVPVLSQEFA